MLGGLLIKFFPYFYHWSELLKANFISKFQEFIFEYQFCQTVYSFIINRVWELY